jgi:hypothetical protein
MVGMNVTQQYRVRFGLGWLFRRSFQFVAVVAAVGLVAWVSTNIGTTDGSRSAAYVDPAPPTPVVELTEAGESPSAALHGEAFASAIDATIVDWPEVRAGMLNGEAFAQAVAQAVAAAPEERSALLDGEAFTLAIDAIVADLPEVRAGMLDGEEFAQAVATVAELNG